MTRALVLPADVELVEGARLEGAGVAAGEVVLLRAGSRERPRVVPAEAAALLVRFRTPMTIAAAVVAHCTEHGGDAGQVLEQAFPVLAALCRAELLAPSGSPAAEPAALRQALGDRVGPAVLTRLVRALRDSEVWEGALADGTPVAVKVGDLDDREAQALRRLAGAGVPDQLWAAAGRLVLSWVAGAPADLAARALGDPLAAAPARRRLCLAVLDAYARLHAHQVLHGDVHTGNVLVDAAGRVVLLDLGLAVVPGLGPPPRAAGGDAVEPEAASALLAGRPPPQVTVAAEQYAVAALLWRLLTGAAHLDLDPERRAALAQVVGEDPAGLVAAGGAPWPAGEAVLRRALAKEPAARWASVAELRDAFAGSLTDDPPLPAAPSWRDVARRLEVDGAVWSGADAGQCTAIRWALGRAAVLTGEPLLAEHRRTGAPEPLAQARAVAAALPGEPAWDLSRGPLARLLLQTECSDPWQARRPAGLVAAPDDE